ncbi:helix-turn-helix domain-containing protein [Pseudoalteromonas luteoviolacea]|nr:helix-turn-helix domain-containing protein [Pseudoalteromonas luteoviolacea]
MKLAKSTLFMWIELQREFYLVCCVLTLFCTGLMLKYEKSFEESAHYLSLANLALMLTPLISYVQLKFNIHAPLISQIANCCILLFCAFTYLFYCSKTPPRVKDLALHCTPFVFFLSVKVIGFHTQTELMYIIYFGLMFSYVTSIWQHAPKSSSNPLKRSKLLLITITYLVALNGLVAVSYLSQSSWTYPLWSLLNISICCYLMTFSFYAAYRINQVSKQNPQSRTKHIITEDFGTQSYYSEDVIVKQRAFQLSDSVAKDCIEKMHHLLKKEQLFLDNQLTLGQLAIRLDITQHQASELLNEHMHTSFYTLLNEHRVKHACQLLMHSKNKASITQIALDSGFNNKSSFYNEFKKQLGTTPNKWRLARQEH